jgi:short-subunit dehydrogenase
LSKGTGDKNMKEFKDKVAVVTGAASGIGREIAYYNVSKHGVVALSETLNHELTMRKTKLKVSVLCPGHVKTRILDCERNRPEDLQNDPTEVKEHPEYDAYTESVEQQIKAGLDPKRVAELVFGVIREEKFYIHTHNELKKFIRGRMEDILSETRSRPPLRIQ